MGSVEFATEAPDTFGLPEYKVSEMHGEIEANGHDVRVAFGAKKFQHLIWHYTIVCSPDDLMKLSRACEALAVEAIRMSNVAERRRSGH